MRIRVRVGVCSVGVGVGVVECQLYPVTLLYFTNNDDDGACGSVTWSGATCWLTRRQR